MGRLLRVCCLFLLISLAGYGQSTFGTITGTVTDPSGAVVPNATVIVTSEAEGTARESTAGSTGVFTVPNLKVGAYRLQVNATGFAGYNATGLNLNANQVLNADVKLSLMQAGAAVEVTDASVSISTETTNISNVKTSRDLRSYR